jgi:AmmeMemoRadiSam system protein B
LYRLNHFNTKTMSTFSKSHNRFASVAGQYYPAGKEELTAELRRLYSTAVQHRYNHTIALIAPHSAYMFSGKIAASAFLQIDNTRTYNRIFILTNSHLDSFIGASVYCDGDYVVPNGIADVDVLFGKKLVREHPNLFKDARTPHFHEHSIEVQLPFLLHHLRTPFKLVPIILGTHTPEVCKQLAQILKPELNSENLFIISSDFSSHLPASAARKLDDETEQAILSNKPERLLRVIEKHGKLNLPGYHTSLYSWAAVLTLMYMSAGETTLKYHTVDQCNSGDIPFYGNYEKVTGFRALAVVEQELSETVETEKPQNLLEKMKRFFNRK